MPSDGAPSVPVIGKRFKRSLLGYRPSEVEEAIAARDAALDDVRGRVAEVEAELRRGAALIEGQSAELAQRRARIAELEGVADRIAERAAGSERELREAREELARLRAQSEDRIAAFAALAEELDSMRAQARGQATRIRLRALRDAAELTERITELTRRPVGMRERLLESLQEAIVRIGSGDDEAAALAESNGHGAVDAAALYDGLIEVEIGPLHDFSQLVGFEDAAAAIGATSEISVRRFAQGRATLDLRLDHPVELLRELEERAPFEFRVRDTRSDRLILDVDDEE